MAPSVLEDTVSTDILKEIVKNALVSLIRYDHKLIENQTKEECINHRLACYIQCELKKKELNDQTVDVEYNKYKKESKELEDNTPIRPDIIVHTRESGNKKNLIVIEAKKQYSSAKDKNKVVGLVTQRKYQYSLGVVISYQPTRNYCIIQYYTEGKDWQRVYIDKDSFAPS